MEDTIYLLEGDVIVLYFDKTGDVTDVFPLKTITSKHIVVPPRTWNTYVVISDRAITYETMYGVYNPTTWKCVPEWAPSEHQPKHLEYFHSLKVMYCGG
jgi:cupin fold WbuC family metalloprotein